MMDFIADFIANFIAEILERMFGAGFGKKNQRRKTGKNRFECRDRRGCLKIEFLKNSLVFMAQKTKNTRFLRHFYNFYKRTLQKLRFETAPFVVSASVCVPFAGSAYGPRQGVS